jgi:hypothetical protein
VVEMVLKTTVRALVLACKQLNSNELSYARAAPRSADCSKAVVFGEVAEWLMAPVLKTGIPERVSGVRIPPSPPRSLERRETWL